jgi:hypothetical protein
MYINTVQYTTLTVRRSTVLYLSILPVYKKIKLTIPSTQNNISQNLFLVEHRHHRWTTMVIMTFQVRHIVS